MYTVKFTVVADVYIEHGVTNTITLSRTLSLPEPPRLDISYTDQSLYCITAQGGSTELFISKCSYCFQDELYVASCEKIQIDEFLYKDLVHGRSWDELL